MIKVLVLFLFISLFSFGQNEYKADLLQITDGLPSDAVLMTTKKDGFLYIATQRGLCMYDGYIFINSPEVKNAVYVLTEKNGKILGEESATGLFEINSIYDRKHVVSAVDYFDERQDNDHFKNIYADDTGNIWCSDFHHVKFFNPDNNTTKTFRIGENKKHLDIIVSYLETPQEVIFATSEGLFIWQKQKKEWQKQSDIRFSSAVNKSGKFLLLSQSAELYEYLPDTKELVLLKTLPQKGSFSLVSNVENNDSLIFYDNQILYRYSLHTNQLKPIFVSEGRINHVFYDAATSIFWISTQNGLIKLSKTNRAIQSVLIPDSSPDPVTDMVEDEKSGIWMVKNSNKLFVKNGEKIRSVTVNDNQINRLSFTQNQLLLAAESGVYRKDENDVFRKIIHSDIPIKKAITYNNKYWLLPEKGAIRVYDSETLKEIPKYIGNDNEYWEINLFNDFKVSPDNKLWLASWMPKDFGISVWDNDRQKFIEISVIPGNEENFVADYFHRIAQLNNGNMIFSSTGGFNIVNRERKIVYSMYPEKNNLACNNIDGIAEDRNGNIWFGCAEGLYFYNLTTGTHVRISKTDGLSSNDITHGFLLTKDNALYISNEKSVEKINPDKILNTSLINELKLTAIKVNNQYLPYITHNISLKEKELTQIELFFSALNYNRKDKLIYRYKLDDGEWNYIGSEPKLSLIRPTHGKYRITVEAGDNLENWQKKNLEFTLEIVPPFYKTIWFSILLFIGFFLGAHFFNVYLVRQEKEKGELKKKIKDNENKMLRSQMNPHFLFNSLNSINSFIIQNKADEAEKYLTAFSKLMRNILDNSRKDTISLRQELETVKLYLDLEAVRLENKFDYGISIDQEVEMDYVQIPPLILQPFLENAIWHGINYKPGNGFINIDIECDSKENSILIISIKDDGVGRKTASKRKNKDFAHKSYGIDITKERLELQGAYNSVEITDLYNEFQEPAGTLVTLKIHIKND